MRNGYAYARKVRAATLAVRWMILRVERWAGDNAEREKQLLFMQQRQTVMPASGRARDQSRTGDEVLTLWASPLEGIHEGESDLAEVKFADYTEHFLQLGNEWHQPLHRDGTAVFVLLPSPHF